MSYKWCIVPQCSSSSIKNKQKVFVSVPRNPKRRKRWLQLARRDSKSISLHSNVFMCEDHFDIEKDTINYMQYKMGFSKKILLADEAEPKKFRCQEDRQSRLSDPEYHRKEVAKRRKKDRLKECEERGSHFPTKNTIKEKDGNIAQEIIKYNKETSARERRKLDRKSYFMNRKNKKIYNERGLIATTGKDLCDCLDETCPGCHFPCPKCNSNKCGHECRCNRKWMYDKIEIEGNDFVIKNVYKKK